MKNETLKKFNEYKKHYSNAIAVGTKGELICIDFQPENEINLLKNLRKNSFFGLINIETTKNPQGTTTGISLPIPSCTNAEIQPRQPEKSYISEPQQFKNEQINIDSFIRYQKIDELAGYTDRDFIELFDEYLDLQTLNGLLMLGFHGVKRANISDDTQFKLAQDVKKGWLQKIRENKPANCMNLANTSQNKSINALVKDALAKIGDPFKNKGDLVAICGRNIIADHPVITEYSDLASEKGEFMLLSQKLVGGLRAINVPYFPENSILITSLKNLSLFLHSGTVRRILENKPQKDMFENYFSMSLDFIVEDYNGVALIENIEINE